MYLSSDNSSDDISLNLDSSGPETQRKLRYFIPSLNEEGQLSALI
jgi:hypothetical protein